jgi:hypothetical protein
MLRACAASEVFAVTIPLNKRSRIVYESEEDLNKNNGDEEKEVDVVGIDAEVLHERARATLEVRAGVAPPVIPEGMGRIICGGRRRTYKNACFDSAEPNAQKGLVVTSSSRGMRQYQCLSPFVLMAPILNPLDPSKTPIMSIVENAWQGSKVYLSTIKQNIKGKVAGKSVVQWARGKEVHASHLEPGGVFEVLPLHGVWFRDLLINKYPVRRSNGSIAKGGKPLFSLGLDGITHLGYLESRRAVYYPLYISAARKTELYAELLVALRAGRDVMLVEPDGPHPGQYPHGRVATPEFLCSALNNENAPFGHGYALAWGLRYDLAFSSQSHNDVL